jgi:hypothetical protein
LLLSFCWFTFYHDRPRRFSLPWSGEVVADQKRSPIAGAKEGLLHVGDFLAVLLLTALLSAALLVTLAGLLVRLLLLLLARLLLAAAALLATLAALLVLLILIGHQITPCFDAGEYAGLTSNVPSPT